MVEGFMNVEAFIFVSLRYVSKDACTFVYCVAFSFVGKEPISLWLFPKGNIMSFCFGGDCIPGRPPYPGTQPELPLAGCVVASSADAHEVVLVFKL